MLDKIKHEKFGEIVGEFTFGFTHKTFMFKNNVYSFFFYDLVYLLIGYMGNVETFQVRGADGDCHELTRDEVEELFNKVYTEIIAVRQEEFCQKYKEWNECATLEELSSLNPKEGWSWRSPALEAYEKGDVN